MVLLTSRGPGVCRPVRMRILALAVALVARLVSTLSPDPAGYIVYCPCMGRFGNQAEQFLGTVAFAKALNRTLVLPPWVEYPPASRRSKQVPFDQYFKVEPLNEYHRSITMEVFMKELAPSVWPPGNRIAMCYSERPGGRMGSCSLKDGNPFESFWDTFSVDFDRSEYFQPLMFSDHASLWQQRFPASAFPVLAFGGAPGSFPATKENVPLQRYMQWSDHIATAAQTLVDRHLKRPYVGLHMRTGADWDNVCMRHVDPGRQLFASAQCLGYSHEHGHVTQDLCSPSKSTVIKQTVAAVKAVQARSVFVASDTDKHVDALRKALRKRKVDLIRLDDNTPHLDLAMLGLADYYIGNCISTFSAFAKRQRDVTGLSSGFWAFNVSKRHREEL